MTRGVEVSGGGWRPAAGRTCVCAALIAAVLTIGGSARAVPTAPPDAPTAPRADPSGPIRSREAPFGDPATGDIVDAPIALGAELAIGAAWYWIDVESNGKD